MTFHYNLTLPGPTRSVFTSHHGPLWASSYQLIIKCWPARVTFSSSWREHESGECEVIRYRHLFIFTICCHLLALQIARMFGMNLGRFMFLLADQISLCFVLIWALNPAICAFLCFGIDIMYNGTRCWFEVIWELKVILMGSPVFAPAICCSTAHFTAALSLPPSAL